MEDKIKTEGLPLNEKIALMNNRVATLLSPFGGWSRRGRIILTIGAWVAYMLMYFLLYPLLGGIIAALSLLPVVVAGWFLGLQTGLLTALLTFPMNMILLNLTMGTVRNVPGLLVATAVLVLIGVLVGRLHDLGEHMKWELTERKKAEDELRESERRFRDIAENVLEWIWEVDSDGKYTYTSPIVEKILGYKLEEILGKHFYELFHPEDREELKKAAFEVFARKVPFREFINRNVHKNGKTVWLSTSGVPILNEKGDLLGYRGADIDITERIRAEKVQASIYRISEEVHSAENLGKLFRLIHETISELMPAKNFYIALYDEAAETLSFPYFVDEYDKPPAPRKIGKGLTEYVLRTGEPLLATLKVFEELVKKGEVEIIGHPAIDWLGVPLKTKDRAIGVLAIQSYTESVRITEEDKDMLMFVSTQIAMAIERKRAEMEIKTRRKYLESVLYNTPNAIVTLDAFCRVLDWNPGAERLFGYTRDEVLGKDIDDLITSPDVKDEAIALTKQVLSEGRLFPLETVRYRKDRTPVNVIVAGSTIQVGEEMQGVAAVYTDITEHKRMETKLSAIHEFSKRISTLLDVEEILTLTLNIVDKVLGHQYCAVHFVDPEKRELYNKIYRGYSKESMEKFRLPLDGPKGVTVWVAREGKPIIVPNVKMEPRYVLGLPEAKSEMAAPLRIGDEVIGVLDVESSQLNAFSEGDLEILSTLASYVAIAIKNSLLFRELSEAKRKLEEWNLQLENKVKEVQQKLLRSERLATIGKLAASLGHELRNPLGVLHNSLYLLNHKLKDADEKVKKQLTIMERELMRSDKIIGDLLNFSRKREPSFAPTDLNEMIEEILSKVEIPGEVKVVKELDSLQTIMADGAQLQSVFLNLITNGLQAMPEGGALRVRTKPGNGYVEVEISDTGVGIPEENLEKIFEPLFTTKSKGVGLGLSVTKRFVENHGGTIEVESKPNAGTAFRVRLPVKREE